jgi:hypothetical protein
MTTPQQQRTHTMSDMPESPLSAPIVESPPPTEHEALTVDTAYELLQDMKDEREEAQERAEHQSIQQETIEPDDSDEQQQSDAVWSTQDFQTFAQLERDIAQYQQDLALFQQLEAQGVDSLAKGDRDKAIALRVEMSEAKAELARRGQALGQIAQAAQSKASQKTTDQVTRYLNAEKAKLAKVLPDLDGKAVARYLMGKRFSREEIGSISDHRLIEMAEKARRYDEMQSGKKLVIPKAGLRPQQRGQAAPRSDMRAAQDRLKESGRIEDALELLTLRKQQGKRA